MSKPTICVDFDGVIHAYSKGWTSATDIYDEPTDGAVQAIAKLRERFRVVVLSTRLTNGVAAVAAVRTWLEKHGIKVDSLSAKKVPAVAYIDDRAVNFDGCWARTTDEVMAFQPWTKAKLGVYVVDNIHTVVAYDEADAIEVIAEEMRLDEHFYEGIDKCDHARRCDDNGMIKYEDDDGRWRLPCWALVRSVGRGVLGMTEP